MAFEALGELSGDGQENPVWSEFIRATTLSYIPAVCGPIPMGCDLDVSRIDHESGSYPVVVLLYSESLTAPTEYIARCTLALDRLNDHMPWSQLEPAALFDDFSRMVASFRDTAEFLNASEFANELLRTVLQSTNIPETLRVAALPLAAALESLPLAPQGLDIRVEIQFSNIDRRLQWNIHLGDAEFCVELLSAITVDPSRRYSICGHSTIVDGDEIDTDDPDDEYDVWIDDDALNVVVANLEHISIRDQISHRVVEHIIGHDGAMMQAKNPNPG